MIRSSVSYLRPCLRHAFRGRKINRSDVSRPAGFHARNQSFALRTVPHADHQIARLQAVAARRCASVLQLRYAHLEKERRRMYNHFRLCKNYVPIETNRATRRFYAYSISPRTSLAQESASAGAPEVPHFRIEAPHKTNDGKKR